jgi:hypothetical protein
LLKSGKQRMIANDLEVSGSGLVIVISWKLPEENHRSTHKIRTVHLRIRVYIAIVTWVSSVKFRCKETCGALSNLQSSWKTAIFITR